MPSYEGPAWSVKTGVLTINAAQFWAIGHYVFNTFKATGNHTITAIRAPGYRTSGATGTIRVGIQAVTGAQMGSLPTGTWLVYEDVAVTTYTTTMANKWITLTTPYTLTKNSFYAIVVNAESGTFNSSTQIFFAGYSTSSYAAGAAFFPTTGRMAASNSVGINDYVLGYRTSSQAYYGVVMPLSDDSATNVEMGARFVVPSGQYSSIECLGIRNKSNGAAQQTVRLYDSSNNVIATATPQFDITVGRAIYDTYWDTAVNLTAGQTYYWGTVCTTSTQWISQVSVDAVTDWLADTEWQFAKARRTTPVSGTWTITTTENYEHQLILGNISPAYLPTERNASAITIAPGSTSQSIELYLGATGLTFATLGLSAYYVRNREAPTPITLVTQTATGTWASGGFAEISSAFTPGLYRLDVPNDAFAAGFSDVTIVVRGASGTNGAVLTVTLSSGGLTAAQTANAVLDAVASSHNNIGSIGASIQDKAGYSLSTPQSFSTTGSVGSVTGNVAGNVTGTVGGVAGNVTGNIAGSVATVASPDNIIDGVWDEQRVGHTASGSFGEKLQTNALADEMLARDLGSGLNLGTTEERTVRSALRAIRNKVNVGSSQMVVKREDDTTDAWTASVTTTAVSSNVSGIDPN